MTGGLVGFERGDSSDDDSSADSDVFGGGSSSGSGRSPDDLGGIVSFGDGEGPSSPSGGYDPIPGGVDETTTGKAPGPRSNYPFVRPEDSHRVSVKNVWLDEDGNVAFRVRGTGLREDKRVRVPIRVDGKLVGRETITLPAGLPDKTVKTDVSPSTGSKIAASNVYMKDVGGGVMGRTSGSDPSQVSDDRRDDLVNQFAGGGSSSTPGTSPGTGMFDGFERPDSGGDILTDSDVFGSDSEEESSSAGSSSAMIVLVAVVAGLAVLSRQETING